MTDWNALRARMDAATEGDWQSFVFKEERYVEEERYVATDEGGYLTDSGICSQVTKPDADFIAHARTDIPEMYDLLVEAREFIERLVWQDYVESNGIEGTICVECESVQPFGHSEGCAVADLIARLPKADR